MQITTCLSCSSTEAWRTAPHRWVGVPSETAALLSDGEEPRRGAAGGYRQSVCEALGWPGAGCRQAHWPEGEAEGLKQTQGEQSEGGRKVGARQVGH